MADLMTICELVAQAGAGPVGGRAYAFLPDSTPVGPEGVLVVFPMPDETVIEPLTLASTYRHRLIARVIVRNVSAQDGARLLSERISPRGEKSVWQALETPGIVPGIDYIQVLRAFNYGGWEEGEARYLSAELECEVIESA